MDLFSGVGSFGLECVSRGALSVTFFENYKKILPILKKNIFNIDLFKISKIVDHNIFDQKAFDNLKKKQLDFSFLMVCNSSHALLSMILDSWANFGLE